MKVIVLGGTGMLGSVVAEVFGESELETWASYRTEHAELEGVNWFDSADGTVGESVLEEGDWVINCVGVIKQRTALTEEFIQVNSLLPIKLLKATEGSGARVLQIATDCVFSGDRGKYTEVSRHGPWDVYGQTKSLGEVMAPGFHNLRCSVIGLESHGKSLLGWFLGLPEGAEVMGYENHWWNGVTTLAFAKVALGVIREELTPPKLQHLVPSGDMTKLELLELVRSAFGREDVTIVPSAAPGGLCDRTLATIRGEVNNSLWEVAGYGKAPTIEYMVRELADWARRKGVA